MATCSTSYFDEKVECRHNKKLLSFRVDKSNKEIEVDGAHYKFDRLDNEWGMVVFIDANCRELIMPLELFGRLHAMALSGIHEFNVLI